LLVYLLFFFILIKGKSLWGRGNNFGFLGKEINWQGFINIVDTFIHIFFKYWENYQILKYMNGNFKLA
jgi:hypothetical protein